ncbi:hypothetical protein GCM10011609_02430 [Lentzea pudingi]|uniref:Uncharacterized protein n=1 Tax=Lentzea pudingi TaxID=1789439 RepID=A0ABQ2HAR5_9PSEU|nr:hypothetical protein [Lentzea pudingi]GGM70250.1 hypothetical protein GCM10011609_02430 [Lentzea pudingi]
MCWSRFVQQPGTADQAWVRAGLRVVTLGSTDVACAFLQWLHRVLATVASPEELTPLYIVHGTAGTNPTHGIW